MLAAIRCLDGAGYEVTATAGSRLAPGLWSRACSSRRIIPGAELSPDDFSTGLLELARSDPHDVLIPGTDLTLYVVSRDRDRFAPHVKLGLPDHAVVRNALNRASFSAHATQVGLAPPPERVCDDPEEALQAARAFGFPVFVKAVHTVVERAGQLLRHPSARAFDEASLRAAQRRTGTCLVQRPSEGTVISFGGVCTEDGLLASVLSRYWRTWPAQAGSACFSETVPSPPALVAQVEALVMAIGWRGLFEVELIRRPDGVVQAIDFNPRPYGSMTLATAAGVPLAALWSAWLLGESPRPATARPGVRYRWEDADGRQILWLLRNGKIRAGIAAGRPRRGVAHAFVRLRDPLPMGARLLDSLHRGYFNGSRGG
jgi:predicted ATP-grasp superfamily ATP-dependent carboligase